MILLPVDLIQVNHKKIEQIDSEVKAIYRLITFSRQHLADHLLDSYLSCFHDLKELLSIKNAQMEAQNEEEAEEYLKHLRTTLDFVVDEIKINRNFKQEVQLFQLFRLVSPEAHAIHPNKYRSSIVQIGSHICPKPYEVPGLVSELFYQISRIPNPIIRAIYFHHELIRIHPFSDGNGRVTRIAKNWMLMFDLYPPIFINNETDKEEYITTLGHSFMELHKSPIEWNKQLSNFFEQELDRLLKNIRTLCQSVYETGLKERQN